MLKAGCIGNNGKNGYSIQGLVAKVKDTVRNKWLIWLVCGEPLMLSVHKYVSAIHKFQILPSKIPSIRQVTKKFNYVGSCTFPWSLLNIFALGQSW